MDEHQLFEYRPGRWAKLEALTGAFLELATIQEIREWLRKQEERFKQPFGAPQGQTPTSQPSTPNPSGNGGEQGKTEPEAPIVQADPSAPQEPEPKPQAEPLTPDPTQPAVEPETPEPSLTPEPTPEPSANPEPEPALEPAPAPEPTPEPAPAPSSPTPGNAGPVYPLPRRYRISSSFRAHKNRKPPSTAPGIDLACPMGTEVRAWTKGTVIRSRWTTAGGRSIWLQHGGDFKTYYAHLNAIHVAEGEAVLAGQRIGESGNTGNSTGPHLHFSIVRNGEWVDPEKYFLPE